MGKKRVSLTIDEDIVKRLDEEAERTKLNRSQKVEKILERHFKSKGLRTAVILCGDQENKTLNLYKGKPVLHHILTQLSEEGIGRAIILAGKNKQEIKEQFGTSFNGTALEYIEEKEPSGTAAALKFIESEISEPFLTLNGHVFSKVDFKDMLKVHRDEEKLATMALTTVEEPSKYGVVKMKGREIQGFEEKPERGEEISRLINAGTYIFEPEIFEKLDHKQLNEVFEDLSEEKQLTGYVYGGKWQDIEK